MKSFRPLRALPTLIALAVVSACADESGDAISVNRTTVTDSAGLQIVTSTLQDLPRRIAGGEPAFSIGSLDGTNDALFDVQAVDRLPSGEWVIANGGTNQLRVFSEDGVFLRAFGGEGEGPGEFANLNEASVFGGDSIFTYDFRARRVSIFTGAGEFVRTVTPADGEGQGRAAPIGILANGNIPASGASNFGSDMQSGTVVRPRVTGTLLASGGEPLRSMDEFGGREQWFLQGDNFISIRSVPFSKTSTMASSDTRIFAGATESPEIRVRSDIGDAVAIWRLQMTPPPVTQADWDAAREDELSRADNAGAIERVESFYADAPQPESHPAWSQMLVSEEGELWLQQFSPPGQTPINRWWHFDREGALIEELELPEGLQLEWVSGDLVVGTWEDEFEVEYVRGYRIGG